MNPSLALAVGLLSPAAPTTTTGEVDVATLFAEHTLVYVEAPGLSALLGQGLKHPFVKRVLDSEAGGLLLAQAGGASPEDLLGVADAVLGRPVLPALSSMTENGVALGVAVKRGQPVWTLVALGGDEAVTEEVLERGVHELLERFSAPPELAEPHAVVRGADVWYFGEELALALSGARLVASNDEGALRDVLDRLDGSGASLAGREDFAAVRGGRAAGSLVFAWADFAGIEALGGGQKLGDLRQMVAKPEVHMLLGSSFALLGQAKSLAADVRLDERGLGLRVDARGVDGGPTLALVPAERAAPASAKPVGSEAARAVLYRDLSGVFTHRTELFPVEKLPGFAKAVTDLTVLFGGLDLEQDVLPGLSPWLTLVAREVSFDEGAEPEIPLPAAALLVELDGGEELGRHLLSAFQTAIGIANIEATQQGRPAMLLRLENQGGVEISYAQFHRPGESDGVDVRYNLVPACAIAGKTFVLGTHRALVAELASQIQRGDVGSPAAPAGESLHFDVRRLAKFVRRNSDAIVSNAVLNEGKSEERAQGELRGVLALMKLVGDARASLGRIGEGEYSLRFDLGFLGGGR